MTRIKQMRRIGFIGSDNIDIVLYLARMGTYEKNTVAILDMTKDKDVLSTLYCGVCELPESNYYKNIYITSNESEKELEEVEYLFIYFGYNTEGYDFDKLDNIIISTEVIPTSAARLSKIRLPEEKGICSNESADLEDVGENTKESDQESTNEKDNNENRNSIDKRTVAIVRNAIGVKYKAKTLLEYSGRKYSKSQIFVLPYNELDYKNKCYLCIDNTVKLRKLSAEMKSLLYELHTIVYQSTVKTREFNKMIRKA